MSKLVIVESPGKVKKIQAILGAGYTVAASVGHVRDLPAKEMGVDTKTPFEPHYVFIPPRRGKAGRTFSGGKERVANLATKAKGCDVVLLATDPDREGESIAWHLAESLHLKHAQRITFDSINKGPILAAIQKPRAIDLQLVRAQEARRVLDRLVGYTASPVLSKRLGTPLSAGRVQSPAVRIVYDRDAEIAAFKPTEHYTATLTFDVTGKPWKAIWDTKPFLKEGETYFTNQAVATKVASIRDVEVKSFENTTSKSAPYAPFTTSTLQQSAQAALKYRPKQTMDLAQKLYEQGAITYHRTDTPNMSPEGFKELVAWAAQHGVKTVEQQRHWKAKAGAQEAHEAIRCSHFDVEVAGETPEQKALYSLIRKRAIASQMPDAIYAVRTAKLSPRQTLGGKPLTFVARGKTLVDPGWKSLYGHEVEEDKPGAKDEAVNNPVPSLQVGEQRTADRGELTTKTTKPPARYTQATLVKRMEELEIGRPSTYAAIMENITRRGYIEEDRKGFLKTCATGKAIVEALAGKCHFIDLDYTRALEGQLDAIAQGKAAYPAVVGNAYQHLMAEVGTIESGKIEGLASATCPQCGNPMQRRKGKRGWFWGCSNYPECKCTAPDLKGKPDLEHASAGSSGTAEKSDFKCKDCGKPLVHRTGTGKKGAYDFWGCSGYPKCKTTYKNGPDDTPLYPQKEAAA